MDYLDNGIVIKDGNGQVIYTKKIADEQMEQKIEAYIGENPEDASVLNKEYILKEASMEKVDWKIYYFIDRNTISVRDCIPVNKIVNFPVDFFHRRFF